MKNSLYTYQGIVGRLGIPSQPNSIYLGRSQVYANLVSSNLDVEPSAINTKGTGGVYGISVLTNENWRITSIPSWITASQMSGSGHEEMYVTVASSSEARNGTITFANAYKSATVTVNQTVVDYVTDIYATGSTRIQIFTGVYNNATFQTRFKGTELQTDGSILIGSVTDKDSNDYRFFRASAGILYFDMGSSRKIVFETDLNFSANTFDLTFGSEYMNSSTCKMFVKNNISDIKSASEMALAAPSGEMRISVNRMHLQRLQMWDNYGADLVFDGRAAVEDGQGGLFDSVTNTFITNNEATILYTR